MLVTPGLLRRGVNAIAHVTLFADANVKHFERTLCLVQDGGVRVTRPISPRCVMVREALWDPEETDERA